MERVLEDFNERAKEVRDYFTFLRDLEQQEVKLIRESNIFKIDTELEKTLKATGYLLLYNLVESTMRNAIELIFDEIQTKNISFDNLKIEFKKLIWKNIRKRKIEQLTTEITTLSQHIINVSFDPNDLFSGNVDSKKIKEIAMIYGFSTTTDSETRDGYDLLSIKTNRNNLAHGFFPFSEVGRDTTANELVEISDRVIKYLRQILENINEYLDNEEYLDQT